MARSFAVDPDRGLPAGRRIAYRCHVCGDVVASMPAHAESCRCGNITVDPDAGRASVKDAQRLDVHETD